MPDVHRISTWFDQDLVSGGETRDADFLDRAATQRPGKSSVMHNFAVAYIDAMVAVAVARSDEMGTERRFRAGIWIASCQERLGSATLVGGWLAHI